MATETFPRDRFDDAEPSPGRIGAHRAERPGLRGGILFLWAALATVVLIVGGILTTMIVSDRIALFPAATPSASATSDPPSVVDTSYSVLVLNATPDPALTLGVQQAVVAAGWDASRVFPADAAARDFPTTTVYYALPEDESAARGLAAAIGGAAVEQSERYQPVPTGNAPAKQLTLVIGLDRTAADSAP